MKWAMWVILNISIDVRDLDEWSINYKLDVIWEPVIMQLLINNKLQLYFRGLCFKLDTVEINPPKSSFISFWVWFVWFWMFAFKKKKKVLIFRSWFCEKKQTIRLAITKAFILRGCVPICILSVLNVFVQGSLWFKDSFLDIAVRRICRLGHSQCLTEVRYRVKHLYTWVNVL